MSAGRDGRSLPHWTGSKPVPRVPRFVVGVGIQQRMQLRNQPPDHSPAAAREPSGIDEDEAEMRLSSLIGGIGKRDEIHDVFSDNSSPFLLGDGKNCGVGH